MHKTNLTKAVAVALATFAASSAFAQSSLTIYGNADVSVDHVSRSKGAAAAGGTSLNATRVSPSATSQTSFGFKGLEDLGGGYTGNFVLEGQLNHDNGSLSQDGRIFGRQAYVGLTTPFGEFRLGRQYAPIFYSTAFVTTERFGATDLFIEGGASNNLVVRWDNEVSYWIKKGAFTGEIAYTPNGGIAQNISARRGVTDSTSQIVGGIGAGAERESKAGRAVGLFLAYTDPSLTLTLGLHHNEFDGTPVQLALPTGTLLSTRFILDKFAAFNLGAKYTVPNVGLILSTTYAQGKYDVVDLPSLHQEFLALGAKMPVNDWAFIAQASYSRFKNFTRGKDVVVMLGTDYSLSKRTTLFARVGQIKDSMGDPYLTGNGTVPAIVGGPDYVGVALGFRETPVFAGANINPDGKTQYVGLGIRHTF